MKPRLIILAITGLLELSACSQTALQKATSIAGKINTDAGVLATDEQKEAPLVAALTGTSSKATSALSYASTIATDAQTLAPLLQSALALFTTADANGGHVWNARGIAVLHRLGIDPADRMALAKLMRHYNLSGVSRPLAAPAQS
jgi:hypothetical protein